ncbi:hypothetical protein [Photobacterium sp. DNB22_13_2]
MLVNRQLTHIILQVASLEKAQHAVKFLEDLSQYHFSNRLAIVENKEQSNYSLASDLRNDVGALFGIGINTRLDASSQLALAAENNKQVVIVSENSLTPLSTLIELVEGLKSEHRTLCLIRNMNSEAVDFGNSIDSLLTYPLLGNRLLKAFQHFYELTVGSQRQARCI